MTQSVIDGPRRHNGILVRDGLASYSLGDGPPVLLMPYPHGYTTESTAAGPVVRLALVTTPAGLLAVRLAGFARLIRSGEPD
ncbi:MAG: hypothetical protein ACM3ZA_09290 [Bacillota bacterium]